MSQPFISVVMPVYNAVDYLDSAVKSLLQQTFSDFELILVNDASSDDSGKVADRLAQEDKRIRVIHKEKNAGSSMARNTGLEHVMGRYVFFMDADDVVDVTLFSQIVSSLEENPAQAVVFGLIEEYYDAEDRLHHCVPVSCGKDQVLDSRESLRREVIFLEEKTLYGYVWNKCYDTAYLREHKVLFEAAPLNEDFLFNVQAFMEMERVNLLSSTPYHYKKRLDGSLTNRFVPAYFELHYKRVRLLYEQYQYWGLLDDQVRRILANIYVRYIFSALQRNCDPRASMSHADRKRFLAELYEQPLFNDLISFSNGSSRLVRLMAAWLKKRRTGLCLLGGRGIYIVKNKLPMVFAKAKQSR